MTGKISATIEDYLGMLYISERDGNAISGTRLAELLGVSTPTVANTLKRMTRDGLITMDGNHSPHLTPRGDELARTVMRRHMLAEWMLIRMLSWSKVHHEAHGFEHSISDEVETALLQELNQPEVCPHGNPLPGHEAAVSAWVPLTSLKAGDCVTIRRIHELAEEIPDLLTFLEEKKISPGQQVKVTEVLPFNQTVTLDVLENLVTLGFSTARQIFVEV
ncbi:MAG: putative DtxR family transcriptional regulator [Chloroflexi bacterium]|nr:MAG: putative DtxR family transcriptional regulator [Chloroflexota bacterium]